MDAMPKERAELLTPQRAADYLGLSRGAMRMLRATGALEEVWLPGLGRPRFRRADLDRLIHGRAAP
jgi:excisionase family DNA binding protein